MEAPTVSSAAAPAAPPAATLVDPLWNVPELVGARGIRDLCAQLGAESELRPAGNQVEQARAVEAHGQRRAEAAGRSYAVSIPPGGFGFGGYDLPGRRLLVKGRAFPIAEGVEVFLVDSDVSLAFSLGEQAAERALESHQRGNLSLRLLVRPADLQLRDESCVSTSGGGGLKLPVHVVAYALVAPDGRPVARAETGAFADDAATPVSAPSVIVDRPKPYERDDVSADVASAAAALGPQLLPCYRKALETRPTLGGTLVLDVHVGGGGQIDSARMEVSAIRDEALIACVIGRIKGARLGRGATRVSLPIRFGSQDAL